MAKVDEIKFWQGTQEQYDNGELSGNFYDWMNASTLDSVYTDTDTPTTSSKVYSEPFVKSPLTITGIEKGLGQAVETTLPSSQYWPSVAYGNGIFVAVAESTNVYAYSTDGINWTGGNMPSSRAWQSVAYGNGKFVAITYGSNVFAYSTDGINWTEGTLPSSQYWQSVTYGNGKFVIVTNGANVSAYSTDGVNWTQSTLPSRKDWFSVTFGNDKFVAVVGTNSNVFAYSTDGINWTEGTLPVSQDWKSITYGNGKFIAVGMGAYSSKTNIYAYSTDGINWTEGTLPSSQYWHPVAYGDDKFVAVVFNSNVYAYSVDGVNWDEGTLPISDRWESMTYGNSKFVIVANDNNGRGKVAYIPFSSSLTLSDTNSYNRNPAGDEEIQTNVGQDHPDYICYINEVGIKIADKFIAVKHPDKSITLELTPGDTSYGWQTTTITNPTSYTMVESTNKGSDSTYSVMKVRFNGYTSLTCYINSYAESSYDYTVVSKLDATSYPTADSSDTAYANTKSKQYDPSTFPGNWTTVTFNGIDGEEHFFYVVYRKDGSASSYNDRGYFIIDEGQ